MIKLFIFLSSVSIFLNACAFDRAWQVASRYPGKLEVHNHSKSKLNLRSVYSNSEAENYFSTTPVRIAPNKVYSFDISIPGHTTVAARQFIVDGHCDGSAKWSIPGKDVTLTNNGEWLLTIEIDCEEILKKIRDENQ